MTTSHPSRRKKRLLFLVAAAGIWIQLGSQNIDGFAFHSTTNSIDCGKSSSSGGGSSSFSSSVCRHLAKNSDPVVTEPTTTTSTTTIDLKILRELDQCQSGTKARQLLERVLPANDGDATATTTNQRLFASVIIPAGASDRAMSDGDLAIQTKIRNGKYGVFDVIDLVGDRDADRASASVLAVFLASSLSAIAANENLPGPEIVRFVVVWIFSFAPLALVGYGIATPDNLQALLISMQRTLFPVFGKRMVQHEAGHFLVAHLLGFPIQGYSTNAVKNAVEFYPLNDPDVGLERAQLLGFDQQRSKGSTSLDDDRDYYATNNDVPFFSKEGRGSSAVETQSVFRSAKNYTDNPFLKIAPRNEPTTSWPYRGFDHGTIDKLAVVSVAGVCAEILAFGNAEGGIADFSQLNQIFANADPQLNERERENRIRFAVGFAMTQLRLHLGVLDALAEVMEAEGSVSECVAAIESCSNVRGNQLVGDYDVRRRQQFKSLASGFLEKILLGQRNADDEEDRMIEGAGGGYRREKWLNFLQLSGDDPLYVALGIAMLFLAWATSGGLSLH